MRKQKGFTLLELMVTVVILGILGATAIPLYRTWQQRAYGSEAMVMMKQLVNGEIMYYLDNDRFFPEVGTDIKVWADDSPSADSVKKIEGALKLVIPVGHHLDCAIRNDGSLCYIFINSDFPIFKNGQNYLWAIVDQEGKVQYIGPEDLT